MRRARPQERAFPVRELRNKHTVLVTEAHTIGSLAVIRSLGSAGYRVIACSPVDNALAFHSNYCQLAQVQPAYGDLAPYLEWLGLFAGQGEGRADHPLGGLPAGDQAALR